MDAIDRLLRDLVTVMELQIQGMAGFQATQMAARDALKTKDWPALERCLHSLDFQAEGLRCLEERRHCLWTEVQHATLGRTGRFFETLQQLPEDHQETVSRLHRELKIQTMGLRGLSEGLAAYVQTAGAIVRAVVHELQPGLRGRLYSRSGSPRTAQAQPLVLNTHY